MSKATGRRCGGPTMNISTDTHCSYHSMNSSSALNFYAFSCGDSTRLLSAVVLGPFDLLHEALSKVLPAF